MTFIAVCIADTKEVFYLGLFEIILSLFGVEIIYIYRVNLEKITKSFYVALTGSFFMIYGIMQGIKVLIIIYFYIVIDSYIKNLKYKRA